MALITTEQRNELTALFVSMFKAAPGKANLTEMVAAVEAGGTLADVAAALAAKADFQAVYPGFLTAEEFADRMIANMLTTDTPDSKKVNVKAYLLGELNAGTSRADLFAFAVKALRGTTKTEYADAQAALTNKVEIANYYSVTLENSSTNLEDLQGVISGVDSTADSVTAAKATLDEIEASEVAQTFNLTTGVDVVTGSGGNDAIYATLNGGGTGETFTNLDIIDGGAGNDTLYVNDVAVAGTTFPSGLNISNIENLVSRGAGTVTINTSTFSGLNKLSVTQAVAATLTAGSSTDVSVTGASGAIIVDGGKSQTVAATGSSTAVTVGATTVSTGEISVSHANQGTATVAVDGGSDVSITNSKVTTGTTTVGQGGAASDQPTGEVTVSSTGAAYTTATANTTLGAITSTGGSKVTVTQSAASSTSAAAADTANTTITQSAVTINGGSATTEATVVQDAAVTAKNGVAAVAGSSEVATLTFSSGMTNGQTITVGGLTFTASKTLTAAQTAAAFADLSKGTTQGSAPAGNGIYSGTFVSDHSTGSVTTSGSNSVVTATSTTKTNAADITTAAVGATAPALAITQGVASVSAVTGLMGVVGGKAVINGAITGADVLTTVSLTGFGAGSTVASDALSSLTLAGSGEDVTVTNASATTLGLMLDGAGTSTNNADANLGATYTSLNITTMNNNSDINVTAGGVTALTVSGDKSVVLTGSTLGALKTVSISGSAGVTMDASGATVTGVDASGTSGNNTITVDPTKATYTGGSGKDSVTTSATGPTKAISLGAGDDTLTLAAGTTSSTSVLAGGDGTDILSMAAVDAETASAATTFEAKFSGFEKLQLGQLVAGQTDTIDLSNMNDINYVISGGTAAGGNTKLVLNKMGASGTVELGTVGAAADITDINLTDATGSSDVLNLVAKVGTADGTFGDVDASGVETLNVTVTDTSTSTINTATIEITDTAAKTITVTGNAALTLDATSTLSALTSLDGSAMTGKLTASTNGTVAQTITGGSAGDALTATGTSDKLLGGAGDDSLIVTGDLATLTGGDGADTFNIGNATTNVNSYATITDLAAGDKIQFSAGAATFAASKVVLSDTAVFQDYANAAIVAGNTGDLSWFQYGGNTYVIENVSNNASAFINNQDIIVKISGAVDLSTASFSSSADTLLIV